MGGRGATDSGQPAPGGLDPASSWPRAAGATLGLDENGAVHLEPTGAGAQALIALVLAALFAAQLTDERRRIKTCRNPRCQVAFYDRSRNNSGVWHSVRVCGRPANLRAHRARRRQVD
ncbi:CGNR zinc finger domain-containing protein [Micromonospora sp. NPDC023737]|uniref:CGNR zinc finger domain-containing protein n=1 Tax=unclassified Micromonospora TaxID=2617518 RepID=UPI0033D41D16